MPVSLQALAKYDGRKHKTTVATGGYCQLNPAVVFVSKDLNPCEIVLQTSILRVHRFIDLEVMRVSMHQQYLAFEALGLTF